MTSTAIDRHRSRTGTREPAHVATGTTAKRESDLAGLLCRAADGDVESWAEINDRFTNCCGASHDPTG